VLSKGQVIEILYRDAETLVVNKPSGIVTHRTELAPDTDVAMTRARDTIGAYVYPVHRLDRGTSGALVFALSEARARELRTAFDGGHVEKVYVALVRGHFSGDQIVDHAIPKSEGGERVPAVTAFELLATGRYENADFSLVRARPKTGRFHQVRRHLSHLRFPIAGDSNYGTGWFNRWARASLGLSRLALHASSIQLPGLDESVRAPHDAAFRAALERVELGAWAAEGG
jgi:tRNA pseudouridine65 synthase